MSIQERQAEDVLAGIREGMSVYDISADRVGSVKAVRFGDDAVDTTAMLNDSGLQAAPEPLRKRLLRAGYIHIVTGLLARDRYATADQIRYVTRDGVYLDAFYGELTAL